MLPARKRPSTGTGRCVPSCATPLEPRQRPCSSRTSARVPDAPVLTTASRACCRSGLGTSWPVPATAALAGAGARANAGVRSSAAAASCTRWIALMTDTSSRSSRIAVLRPSFPAGGRTGSPTRRNLDAKGPGNAAGPAPRPAVPGPTPELAGPRSGSVVRVDGRLLDLHEELGVALGLLHLVEEQLDRLLLLQRVQDAAELPDDGELLGTHQDLLLTGTGGVHVHGREDPLVGELPVELELHVARALELLEDDLVHPGPGLHQGGREDGQRAAVLDVAGGAEEPLRRVQGGGVDTAGQDPPARRSRQVVGPAEAGDRVEQHDHVVTQLHQPLGPLDG